MDPNSPPNEGAVDAPKRPVDGAVAGAAPNRDVVVAGAADAAGAVDDPNSDGVAPPPKPEGANTVSGDTDSRVRGRAQCSLTEGGRFRSSSGRGSGGRPYRDQVSANFESREKSELRRLTERKGGHRALPRHAVWQMVRLVARIESASVEREQRASEMCASPQAIRGASAPT